MPDDCCNGADVLWPVMQSRRLVSLAVGESTAFGRCMVSLLLLYFQLQTLLRLGGLILYVVGVEATFHLVRCWFYLVHLPIVLYMSSSH